MKRPLAMNRVDRELRNQFKLLMEALRVVNTDREEIEYEALNRRILQEVTDKPILARIITSRAGVGAGVSLLFAACSRLNLDTSHDVIKCLIQTYPRALITYSENGTPLYMIARHPQHCVLMPWIAINHSLFLDHEFDSLGYPGFAHKLVHMYERRGNTSCTAITIKNFFEAYPRALTRLDSSFGTILHRVLRERECEVGLFKWMAERCPSSHLLEKGSLGTPLHQACFALVRHLGPDSSEICKYLIQTCPESVRFETSSFPSWRGSSWLPIRILCDKCDYRVVREVVVCMLREYPESYDVGSDTHDDNLPRSIPFIQGIKPYLDEEKELKETAASLIDSASSFTKAVTCTNDQMMRSTSTVFDSWATSFINTTEDKVNLISMKLQDMCNKGRESNE